jgi:hypothetical protein
MWPLVEKHDPASDFRREFTTALLELFLGCDVDPTDIRGLHPEIDDVLKTIENRPCAHGFDDETLDLQLRAAAGPTRGAAFR